jgi:putative acyl-CoA dehydrogenase
MNIQSEKSNTISQDFFNSDENPGLKKFELSEYLGIDNENFYTLAPTLRRYLARVIPKENIDAVHNHLNKVGKIAGGILNELIMKAHQEGKYGILEKYDRHGNRIDNILYCEEQNEARRIAFEAGIVNLDCHPEWNIPFYYEHREACAYIINMNGEGGIACPLAMTEGLIEMLNAVGTEEQKNKWLPILTDPSSKSYFMAGQYLTERVGGSNVGANRTIARPLEKAPDGKNKPGSKWLLHGEKWFCSNPGDVWVTTAKIEGTNIIGVFLVSRFKDDGTLNNHHILRTKDIIGTRGKVTTEIEYRNVEAELLGRTTVGFAYLMRHVINTSRIHVGLGAIAGARRAFLEARAYSEQREAFSTKIRNFDSIKRILASLQTLITACELAVFDNWHLRVKKDKSSEILSPLLKYIGSNLASFIAHEAILIHGGNGILNDYSILPRLKNDAVINETWEGTHHIIAGHTIKAFGRKANQESFWNNISERKKRAHSTFKKFNLPMKMIELLDVFESDLKSMNFRKLPEANRLAVCNKIYNAHALSLLILETFHDLETVKYSRAEESPFFLISTAFTEIMDKGFNAILPDNSVLMDPNKTEIIINYT